MFEEPLIFEGQTITIDGQQIEATCGPERREPLDRFDGAIVTSMKVVGPVSDLPILEGVRVDINGVDWEVENVSIISSTAVVTFIRYQG